MSFKFFKCSLNLIIQLTLKKCIQLNYNVNWHLWNAVHIFNNINNKAHQIVVKEWACETWEKSVTAEALHKYK